jgi:transcriptional regulator with XRE-family HTH domain
MDSINTQTRHSIDTGFSQLLRHWRQQRRFSQLELAAAANVSGRHLSFLESGRSRPSRGMVQLLGIALDLPLEERNALHVSAGFVPPYGDRQPASETMPHVRQALDFILVQQEPYPAIVIDGHWDIRIRNEATRRMFAPFHAGYDVGANIGDNAMHTVFHPGALRKYMVNWTAFAGEMLQILHREVAQGSRVAAQLLKEVMDYPGMSAFAKPPRSANAASPVMTMQLEKDDYRVSFFSTFTTFAMPADAALQQLKLECFYPADDITAAIARDLAK